jgi:sentrin-specific protease 1
LFYPININDAHWALVIVLIREKIILYRDALGNLGQFYTNAIKKYIFDEWKCTKGIPMTQVQMDEWVEKPIPPYDSPKQGNGFDCGMFVCMYADYMLNNLPERFSQNDMPMLREKICYCILTGKLLYTI